MKKFSSIILIISILAFVPATSYAIFDLGVYGGYSFTGQIHHYDKADPTLDKTGDPTGFTYGVIGHFNTPIFPLLRAGLGLYSEYSKLSYSVLGKDYNYGRKVIGIDVYLQLDIPLVPLHPYLKFASAAYEEFNGDLKEYGDERFKTYKTGIGAALTFFPMLQIFAEYQYMYTRDIGNDKATGQGVALGVRMNI